MKIVFDTNVLLAAFGTRGMCEALLHACIGTHELVSSHPILDELIEHLGDKFKMPEKRVSEIVAFVRAAFEIAEPSAVPPDACRDADDLMVLGTALAAGADFIVTGDKDLLSIGKYRGILILSPRAFYDRLK